MRKAEVRAIALLLPLLLGAVVGRLGAGGPRGIAVVGVVALGLWGLVGYMRASLGTQLAIFLFYDACLEGPLKLTAPHPAVKLVVYVLRDLLLYGALYLAARRGDLKRLLPASLPLRGGIALFVALVGYQLFNPSGLNLVNSLAGSRVFWEMIPLFFLGLALLRDPEAWAAFTRVALVCGILNAVAAYVQFSKGVAWIASLGPGYAAMMTGPQARAFLDASGHLLPRPPGLGSDMGFAASLAFFLWPLLLGTRLHPRLKAAWPLPLGLVTLGALAIGVLVSQARSILLLSPLMVGVYLLLAFRGATGRVLAAFPVLAVLVALGVQVFGAPAVGNVDRYRSVLDVAGLVDTFTHKENRSDTAFETPITYAQTYFWGNGLGKVGPGGGLFAGGAVYEPTNAENNLLLMITETGVPATLCLLGLHLAFLWQGARAWRRATGPVEKCLVAIPFSTLLTMLLLWPLGNFVTFPANAIFWLYGGALTGMARGGIARTGDPWPA